MAPDMQHPRCLGAVIGNDHRQAGGIASRKTVNVTISPDRGRQDSLPGTQLREAFFGQSSSFFLDSRPGFLFGRSSSFLQ
jgi:hypothetical protein